MILQSLLLRGMLEVSVAIASPHSPAATQPGSDYCPFFDQRFTQVLQLAQSYQSYGSHFQPVPESCRAQKELLESNAQIAVAAAEWHENPSEEKFKQIITQWKSLLDQLNDISFIHSLCGRELFLKSDFLLLLADSAHIFYQFMEDKQMPASGAGVEALIKNAELFAKAFRNDAVDLNQPELRQAFQNQLCLSRKIRKSVEALPLDEDQLRHLDLEIQSLGQQIDMLRRPLVDLVTVVINELSLRSQAGSDHAQASLKAWIALRSLPSAEAIQTEAQRLQTLLALQLPGLESSSHIDQTLQDLEAGNYAHQAPTPTLTISNDLKSQLQDAWEKLTQMREELVQWDDPHLVCAAVQSEVKQGHIFGLLVDTAQAIWIENQRLGYRDAQQLELEVQLSWFRDHLGRTLEKDSATTDVKSCGNIALAWLEHGIELIEALAKEFSRIDRNSRLMQAQTKDPQHIAFNRWTSRLNDLEKALENGKALRAFVRSQLSKQSSETWQSVAQALLAFLVDENSHDLIRPSLEASPTLAWFSYQLGLAEQGFDYFLKVAQNTHDFPDADDIDPEIYPGAIPQACAHMYRGLTERDRSAEAMQRATILCEYLNPSLDQNHSQTLDLCSKKAPQKRAELKASYDEHDLVSEEERIVDWMRAANCDQIRSASQ